MALPCRRPGVPRGQDCALNTQQRLVSVSVAAEQRNGVPAEAPAAAQALTNSYHQDIESVLLSEEQIRQRIADMGQQLAKDYATRAPLVLGVSGLHQRGRQELNGCLIQAQEHAACVCAVLCCAACRY
jgi:hypothetical protein